MKTCCFTGHRMISKAEQEQFVPKLKEELYNLVKNEGVAVFRNGGALGFDTITALLVIELKKEFPDIKLLIDAPHKNQSARWKEFDRVVYDYILKNADRITYLSEEYFEGCMQYRNRYMVNNSDFVIAYIKRARGGAYYTASYAESEDKKVIYI